MNKVKNRLLSLAALLCFLLALTGCHFETSMAYTFSVDNGDSIKVSLNTTSKYTLTSDVPFTISHDGEVLSHGAFIHGEAYAQYANVAKNGENSRLLDAGTKDGNEYVFWCYNDQEYNYAISVAGSNTGIVLGNMVSEESAKECFNRLTISVAD